MTRRFENAGLTRIEISYGRTAGGMRLCGLVAGLLGFDESRLVRAVKPLPVWVAGDVSARNAVGTPCSECGVRREVDAMRKPAPQAAVAAIAAGLIVVAPRLRGTTWQSWFTKLAWSWAGVPSGIPGWISSNWTMPVIHAPIYPVMARELDLQPEDDLLEVACGSGVFLATQAAHARHVAGLDLSDIQVALARRRLVDRIDAGTAEIVKGDAAQLPWHDGRFSVVTCMGSVEAFPDPGAALAEMYRVLHPGGRIVVSLGAKVAEGTETHRVMGAAWVWNEDDARRLVEEAGFAETSVTYASIGFDSRLGNLANRLMGQDEMRVVRGVKPVTDAPARRPDESSREPVGASG